MRSVKVPRLILSGKLARKNLSWEAAREEFEIAEDQYVVPEGGEPSLYLDRAFQGATIVPRAAWFVTIPEPENGEVVDTEQPYVESDRSIERKKPWDEVHIEGEIESEFLFGTVLGRDIVPFALERIRAVVLPLATDRPGRVELLNSRSAIAHGSPGLAAWLGKVEKEWDRLKKKGSRLDIYERLDFHRLLTSQSRKAPHRVIFTAAGTHVTAAVLDNAAVSARVGRVRLNGFIVEHKFYVISAATADEAYYLVAVQNSPSVDREIKPYQTVGLFGERDIERRVLEVIPVPLYDATNPTHVALARLGHGAQEASEKVLPSVRTLGTGRKRTAIRQALKAIQREIDSAVRKLVRLGARARSTRKVVKGQTRFEFC